MALHTELQIYRTSYEFLTEVIELERNMPRDYKSGVGKPVLEDCRAVMRMIRSANIAKDKAPHLEEVRTHLADAELLLRLSLDKRLISQKQYAAAVRLSQSVGRQATAWRNKCAASPAV